MRFQLIDANKVSLPIDKMCTLLEVSVSGIMPGGIGCQAGANWMI